MVNQDDDSTKDDEESQQEIDDKVPPDPNEHNTWGIDPSKLKKQKSKKKGAG